MSRPENAPRAAVVIPCFDDPYVEEAIDSVLVQEPCEIVVVDDGSTDPEGLAALDRLRERGIRVVRQENQGLSAARMTGIRETTAPVIFPLDSDDVLKPGAIARLTDALEAHPDAAVAFGDVTTFGAADGYFRNRRKDLDPWWLTYMSPLPGTSMVRREPLLEAGGWQLNEGGYEDWDLWMAMARRGFRGVYVPGVIFSYRIHPEGRMWADAAGKHERLYGLLQERHAELFTRRRENWKRSIAPLRVRLLFPPIDRLPLSGYDRRRLLDVVENPGHVVRPRVEALLRRTLPARSA